MRDTGGLLTALGRAVGRLFGTDPRTSGAPDAAARVRRPDDARGSAESAARGGGDGSPGRSGLSATVEVDPRTLGRVVIGYAPERDGDPDPGEIVWTWVPYEENDGRGKDRPVVIVAAGERGDFLAVQLTSKAHDRERDFVGLGTGSWDPAGRPSWARIDRVFRVWPHGMRREAASLDARRYATVAGALSERYGWR